MRWPDGGGRVGGRWAGEGEGFAEELAAAPSWKRQRSAAARIAIARMVGHALGVHPVWRIAIGDGCASTDVQSATVCLGAKPFKTRSFAFDVCTCTNDVCTCTNLQQPYINHLYILNGDSDTVFTASMLGIVVVEAVCSPCF